MVHVAPPRARTLFASRFRVFNSNFIIGRISLSPFALDSETVNGESPSSTRKFSFNWPLAK